MNDRIYELAEQAAEFTDANEFAAIERRIWDSIFRNKFAELIVRECILTIQLKMPRDGSTPENIRSREHVQDIKQHFGVE